ncbi:LOW QUALITY PROTEIN: putative gustatory receptor 58c [Drosophila eugracilis]|uniref:LOW QUALITY PROTEIN: putative gustatory receptor 58c n=1 Tax=Drosophila eugracilis TaxID=29029 RepID=UPI001BDA75A6|nr:LOW QUALITY PROTEIN: putative gustatory receptor 58c [Drosophila eugracilis]
MAQLYLLRIYFEVSRLIGLCNLQYDSRNHRFILYHVPTVIYCVILNVAYILILPFALTMLTGNIYKCPNVGMFGVVYNVVALTKLLTMLLLMFSVWIQRRRLQELGNDLMGMLRKYRFALGNDCRRMCLCKLLLTSSRFVLLTQQLITRDSVVRCEQDSKFKRSMLPYHLASIVYALIMILLMSYVDLTVYMIQIAGNWLLVNFSQRVQEMIQDLEALPPRYGIPREMGLKQILPGWRKLWKRCLHLDQVLKQILDIFQWQLLFNLLTTYIFNIATLFRLWIFIEFDQTFNVWKGIFCVFLFLTHHIEIIMQFSIFEINRWKWWDLLQRVVKFSDVNFLASTYENSHGMILSRQLEFSIYYLNRKLQLNPKRVRRLHIVGLFDLSNSSVHAMSRNIITSVLVLCQIAYKIYG